MKRTDSIRTSLLAAVTATLLAGCSSGPQEVRRCVDDQGRVLPDSECEQTRRYSNGGYYGGGYRAYPHWLYGGQSNGRSIVGGRLSPSEGAHVVTPSGHTISRGGFGGRGFFGLG